MAFKSGLIEAKAELIPAITKIAEEIGAAALRLPRDEVTEFNQEWDVACESSEWRSGWKVSP